jgi:integrase
MRTPGEGSVYRTADGRWRCVVTLGLDGRGKPLRKYLPVPKGATEAQAKAILRAALRDRDAGALTLGPDMLFSEWIMWWLEQQIRPKRAPRTYSAYLSVIENWVIGEDQDDGYPGIGRVRLSKLTAEHLDQLYAAMISRGSKQVPHAHAVIRRSLRIAVRYGRVGKNVAELVERPTQDRIEVTPFDLDAVQAILSAAKGHRNAARWSVACAIGLRQGEALGLTWSDIDLDTGVLQVRTQLQRLSWRHGCTPAKPWSCGHSRAVMCPQRRGPGGLVLRSPKSKKSRRTITLPAGLLKELKAHRQAQLKERLQEGSDWVGWRQDGQPVDLVFARRDGTPIDPSEDRANWTDLLERAEVEYQRGHDARHTAATMLLVMGVDVKVVSELLGHSTTTLTQNTYQHVVPELRRAAAAAIDGLLWGDPGSSSGSRTPERQRTSAGKRKPKTGT